MVEKLNATGSEAVDMKQRQEEVAGAISQAQRAEAGAVPGANGASNSPSDDGLAGAVTGAALDMVLPGVGIVMDIAGTALAARNTGRFTNDSKFVPKKQADINPRSEPISLLNIGKKKTVQRTMQRTAQHAARKAKKTARTLKNGLGFDEGTAISGMSLKDFVPRGLRGLNANISDLVAELAYIQEVEAKPNLARRMDPTKVKGSKPAEKPKNPGQSGPSAPTNI